MKHISIILVSLLVFSSVQAVEVEAELGYQSSYAWRGLKVSDIPVFQPSVTFLKGAFYINVWGNIDLNDDDGRKYEFNEVDYTLGWEKSSGNMSYTLGAVMYAFPGSDDDSTTELFAGVSWNMFLNPSIMVYRDIDLFDSTYLQCGIYHTFPLQWSRTQGLDVFATVGYGDTSFKESYFTSGHMGMTGNGNGHGDGTGGGMGDGSGMQQKNLNSGLADYSLGLELPVEMGKGVLSFNLVYTSFADSDMHSPNFEDKDSQTVYGLVYRISF